MCITLHSSDSTHKSLTHLDLGCNFIGDWGCKSLCTVLPHLTNLTEFGMGWNYSRQIESKILQISKQIIQMAINGAHIQKVWGLNLNKAASQFGIYLPPEADTWGNDKILKYIRDLRSSGSITIKRVKIMLVGPGKAGKTTLVHRIKHGQFNPDFQFTDGVDVTEWKCEDEEDDDDLEIQGWDFGGQDIYFTTHPMFFSSRSIYLVVWNPRATSNNSSLIQKYLWTIRSRASCAAPILFINTHADEAGGGSAGIDMAAFNRIVSEIGISSSKVYNISSKTGQGIDELMRDVRELALQQFWVTRLFPKSYSRLWDWLKEERSKQQQSIRVPLVHIRQVEEIALSSGIGMKDVGEVHRALSLLHDWGIILSLHDYDNNNASSTSNNNIDINNDCNGLSLWDLSDIIFLDPSRLTELFSSVVSWNTEKQNRIANGILKHCETPQIWPDCDLKVHGALISLLHHFEIGYPLRHPITREPRGETLIPAMLGSSIPPSVVNEVESIMTNKGLEGEYSMAFIPPDFIHRLIVRTQDLHIDGGCRKDGTVVKLGNAMGLIQIKEEKKISICVCGSGYKILSEILCGMFSNLLNGPEYSSSIVRVSKKVVRCVGHDCDEWISERQFKLCIEKQRDGWMCSYCETKNDIEIVSIGMLAAITSDDDEKDVIMQSLDKYLNKLTRQDIEGDAELCDLIKLKFCKAMNSSKKNRSGPCIWIPVFVDDEDEDEGRKHHHEAASSAKKRSKLCVDGDAMDDEANEVIDEDKDDEVMDDKRSRGHWKVEVVCEGNTRYLNNRSNNNNNNSNWHFVEHQGRHLSCNIGIEEIAAHRQYFHRSIQACELVGLLDQQQAHDLRQQLDICIQQLPMHDKIAPRLPRFMDWVRRLKDEHGDNMSFLHGTRLTSGEMCWLCDDHRWLALDVKCYWDGDDGQMMMDWIRPTPSSMYEISALGIGSGGMQLVKKLFNIGNPSSIEIVRVDAVRNGDLRQRFDIFARMKNEGRMEGGSLFNAQFAPDGEKELIFENRLKPHFVSGTGYDRSYILYGWHGCDIGAVSSICQRGFQGFRKTDEGYFGAGVYLTLESEYAAGYSTDTMNKRSHFECKAGCGFGQVDNKEYAMILCQICVGCVYPISRKTEYLAGSAVSRFCFESHLRVDKAMKAGFDCHFITVSPRCGWQCAEIGEIIGGSSDLYDEIVVKELAQVNPIAVVYFRPKHPKQ